MDTPVKFIKQMLMQPKSLISIFIVTAAVTLSSVLIELNQSKAEMLELMEKQSHTLLETILTSSNNALISYEKIESSIKQRLLDNATMIKMLFRQGLISNNILAEIANKNNINRINIFNRSGVKLFSSHKEIHKNIAEVNSPKDFLRPIFNGETDTLIIGLKKARFEEGQRFAVAVSSGFGGAIVLNIDAEELLRFRKDVGFGTLLKNVTKNKQIVYAALQDEKGIIAGAGEIGHLESLNSSDQLKNPIKANTYAWRIIKTGSFQVFEALHPFTYNNEVIGIFRVGISLDPLNKINERLTRRVIILGIVLFIFGFLTLTLIFVRQNFDVLSKRFKVVESYSEKIIQNVSDAIIVLTSDFKIKILNSAAEKLLGINGHNFIGYDFKNIFNESVCQQFLNSDSTLLEHECYLNDKKKILLISKSEFNDETHSNNIILVVKDLTSIKQMEEQIIRNERLTAMGELASSVAHEIRNPLNSIGTITQQLGKDFSPTAHEEEYKNMINLVYSEVKRINETIESFLNFAKPRPKRTEYFDPDDILEQLRLQYDEICRQKEINFKISNSFNGMVKWDKKLITQVFINLIQNAIEALPPKGELSIKSSAASLNNVEIEIADTGNGISADNLKRIFNLYFTTKKSGSGIGLSVVQQIISEHNGIISVSSEVNKGTKFTIQLPNEVD